MASLQIRNLPDDVYQALAFRAERAHRSLAQQAVIELRQAPEEVSRKRRFDVLKGIRQSVRGHKSTSPLSAKPEELIRSDRER